LLKVPKFDGPDTPLPNTMPGYTEQFLASAKPHIFGGEIANKLKNCKPMWQLSAARPFSKEG
jgi:hypothetical protein